MAGEVIVKVTARTAWGEITPTGAISKLLDRAIGGALESAGTVVALLCRFAEGTIGLAGDGAKGTGLAGEYGVQ